MTKKTLLLSMITVIVLLACSTSDIPFLAPAAPTPFPLVTAVPPTATASQAPVSAVTSTPTTAPLSTEIAPTFPPPSTATAAPTMTATATMPTSTATATALGGTPLSGTGFDAINLSTSVFHWGACEPTTATLTASVTNPTQVTDVVLFTRLGNKTTGFGGSWAKGVSMSMVGPGVYSRTLNGPHMDVTEDTWIQFQLVGADAAGKVVARSPIYRDSLSLSPCP